MTSQRQQIVDLLRQRASDLRARGVRGRTLFGSMSRGDARGNGDADLLVELDEGAEQGFGVEGLREARSHLLDHEVGLAFAGRLLPEFRQRILSVLVLVF